MGGEHQRAKASPKAKRGSRSRGTKVDDVFPAHTKAAWSRSPKGPLDVFGFCLWKDFEGTNRPLGKKEGPGAGFRDGFSRDSAFFRAEIEEALGVVQKQRHGAPALAVFSLWTATDGSKATSALIEASRSFPVVAEVFGRDGCERLTIFEGGKVVARCQQTIAYAAERGSEKGEQLAVEVNAGNRLWIHPDTGHVFLYLICGEANMICGSEDLKRQGWYPKLFPEDPLRRFNVSGVLNPTHTYQSLPACHRQRAYLSRSGRLVVSCNTTYENLRWRSFGLYRSIACNPWWQNRRKLPAWKEGERLYWQKARLL